MVQGSPQGELRCNLRLERLATRVDQKATSIKRSYPESSTGLGSMVNKRTDFAYAALKRCQNLLVFGSGGGDDVLRQARRGGFVPGWPLMRAPASRAGIVLS